MGVLGDLIATIAIRFLQAWLARVDLKERTRLELTLEIERVGHEAARKALEWKADAAGRPGGGAELGVRPGGGKIILPGGGADPHG